MRRQEEEMKYKRKGKETRHEKVESGEGSKEEMRNKVKEKSK